MSMLGGLCRYGDGEPTDSCATLYKWLEAKAQADHNAGLLSNLSFGVFGLGNRQYENFNAVGKHFDTWLGTLGGTRLLARGEGDDDDCIEDDFSKWMEGLWPVLDDYFRAGGLTASLNPSAGGDMGDSHRGEGHASMDEARYTVAFLSDAPVSRSSLSDGIAWPPLPVGQLPDVHHPCAATVAVARELHADSSDRSCMHVELDIATSEAGGKGPTQPVVGYEHGDHVGVFATNPDGVVERVAASLRCSDKLESMVVVTAKGAGEGGDGGAQCFGTPCSLRVLLSHHVDLTGCPKKSVLRVLASCAKDDKEAARLRFLASSEGKAEYASWALDEMRGLADVLSAFPSLELPLDTFLSSVANPMVPRYYSISSAPSHSLGRLHITCAVVHEVVRPGRVHEGLCSTFLQRSHVGDRVPIFVRHTPFKLPADTSTPVVMVGPGTGLAPFRGFLQERASLLAKGKRLGPAHLFFGCRHESKDFIYREELEEAQRQGVVNLHIAFSRDGANKVYVQHLMRDMGAELWPLLKDKTKGGAGGHLYVCGDAKAMAKDVHAVLVDVICEQEGVGKAAAEEIMKHMHNNGKYMRDVW
eukprot:jgi/Mesvir1/19558/Mv07030-RA.1